ncbi:hypothetical protein KHA80_22030 [Anaerobacillus sp. HL2]|nr:hypothetical protein KHA80_22030 [Anaerobacillus sp. HL2]
MSSETTATPIIVLIPGNSFVGYNGFYHRYFVVQNVEGNALIRTIYLQSIPFNFFAIVIIFVELLFSSITLVELQKLMRMQMTKRTIGMIASSSSVERVL